MLDLTGRCEWDGKKWDLSDKRKRAFVIDQVIGKNALLVITKDANRAYRDMTNEEFDSKDKKYKERIAEEIRQHRSACRAVMQIQKENSMYAIHIGDRGGTKLEGVEEVESEQMRIAAIMRKG